ncbi:APO protein 2, chloroplastic [Panicum miliaceum]|uniref:APO protein 2, chloroplastic n=1 Tax=Panicum miliaceum TaxID=4540 RepID=A0A3L6RN15_PANMI|nr:APO protein 2, chloroplastic [Panicum miliaceum]
MREALAMRPSTSPLVLLHPPTCSSRLLPLRSFVGLRWSGPRFQVRERAGAVVGVVNGTPGCGLRLGVPALTVCRPHQRAAVIRNEHAQNADLPRKYSKREKKPFPIPVLELRRRAKERMKAAQGKPKRPLPPPKNGMLVRRLIPVAYKVYNARILLINNLRKLMKVVPVKGCKYCSEIHVGAVGHPFRTCRGMMSAERRGEHDWGSTLVEAVFLPVEAYHLEDRLGKRIPHEQRFAVPRIPALVELCIQAGVDLPEYPTKRRRKPIIKIGKNEFVDADEDDLPEPEPDKFKQTLLEELHSDEIIAPSTPEETAALAEETLEAWETVRDGALKLIKGYAVRVCGYCPEVHVGPTGHKARNCGAFKHQQRNGQHGWQAAVLDDLIPHRYVWHMPESGEELQRELKTFYGQAPAVVEICIQGGAKVPEKYKGTMRLDIGIPSSLKEAEMVI